jgi:hypothetical protein
MSSAHRVSLIAGSEQRERILFTERSGNFGSGDLIACPDNPGMWSQRSRSCRILHGRRTSSPVR